MTWEWKAVRAAEHVDPIPEGLAILPGLHDDMTATELRQALRAVVRPANEGAPGGAATEAGQ